MIRIGQKIQCLPYAGFFNVGQKRQSWLKFTNLNKSKNNHMEHVTI